MGTDDGAQTAQGSDAFVAAVDRALDVLLGEVPTALVEEQAELKDPSAENAAMANYYTAALYLLG